MTSYLPGILNQFKYYQQLGQKTIDQLSDDEIFWQPDPSNNSIAIIVKHLWGNMLSRWTDFLTSDGEKVWRERDAEFENDIKDRLSFQAKWDEGWNCLYSALEPLTEKDLDTIVYIRNQGHTVHEAVNRQLADYSYHVGQIVYLGKLIRKEQWVSLSIPKGESAQYNYGKFTKDPTRGHYTDEFLKDN